MKKFLALVGTYAAGLAVAMKLRKDKGTSKLAKDSKDITAGNIIDEIVDIHKTAYTDIKNAMAPIFEDVKDFDGLKAKVAEMVDEWSDKLETAFADLKEEGEEKKEVAMGMLEDAKTKAEKTLETAKEKAVSFGDQAEDKIEKWIADIKKKFDTQYAKLKTKVEKMEDKA